MTEFKNGERVKYVGGHLDVFLFVGLYPRNKEHAVVCLDPEEYSGFIVVRLDEIEAV